SGLVDADECPQAGLGNPNQPVAIYCKAIRAPAGALDHLLLPVRIKFADAQCIRRHLCHEHGPVREAYRAFRRSNSAGEDTWLHWITLPSVTCSSASVPTLTFVPHSPIGHYVKSP